MLKNKPVMPTLPIVDITRAKKFYKDTLGLNLVTENDYMLVFESAGTKISLYKREATKADNTSLTFEVENIEDEVKDLKKKGVHFEEYNIGELKTVDSIATWKDERSAWFKDTEGNILCVHAQAAS